MEDAADDYRVPGALRGPDIPGIRRLVYLLTRYGKAIRYDLAALGWDLADLWRRRRWQFLLDVIDQLPRNSRLTEAQADDDELALEILRRQEANDRPAQGVRLSEFGPLREELMIIADRLGALINIQFGKQYIRPRLRPVTAIDRVKEIRRRERHEYIVAKVLPHKRIN